jgi:hypothetical protein
MNMGVCQPVGPGSAAVVGRPHATGSWRRQATLSLLALAFVAPALSAGPGRSPRSEAAWVAAPVVAVPVAAEPQVAHPTEALGDCDFWQRFLVTLEVDYHRCEVLALSLLGGLHGP